MVAARTGPALYERAAPPRLTMEHMARRCTRVFLGGWHDRCPSLSALPAGRYLLLLPRLPRGCQPPRRPRANSADVPPGHGRGVAVRSLRSRPRTWPKVVLPASWRRASIVASRDRVPHTFGPTGTKAANLGAHPDGVRCFSTAGELPPGGGFGRWRTWWVKLAPERPPALLPESKGPTPAPLNGYGGAALEARWCGPPRPGWLGNDGRRVGGMPRL